MLLSCCKFMCKLHIWRLGMFGCLDSRGEGRWNMDHGCSLSYLLQFLILLFFVWFVVTGLVLPNTRVACGFWGFGLTVFFLPFSCHFLLLTMYDLKELESYQRSSKKKKKKKRERERERGENNIFPFNSFSVVSFYFTKIKDSR